MAGRAIRFRAEPLRSRLGTSITTGYQIVGTAFANPIRILKFFNQTDKALLISYNGVDDHDIIETKGYFILDVMANKADESVFYAAQGDAVYIKVLGVAVPTTGSLYVSTYYGQD